MSLSDTQRAILTAAAEHPERLACPAERLPAGARQKVAQALLRQDLVATTQMLSDDASALWAVDGESVLLQVTGEGMRAIGIEPAATAEDTQQRAAETSAQDAPTAPQDAQEPAPQGEDAPAPKAAQDAPSRSDVTSVWNPPSAIGGALRLLAGPHFGASPPRAQREPDRAQRVGGVRRRDGAQRGRFPPAAGELTIAIRI